MLAICAATHIYITPLVGQFIQQLVNVVLVGQFVKWSSNFTIETILYLLKGNLKSTQLSICVRVMEVRALVNIIKNETMLLCKILEQFGPLSNHIHFNNRAVLQHSNNEMRSQGDIV